MEKVIKILKWGDFDIPVTIGICTSIEKATKLIIKKYNVKQVTDKKFKEARNNNGEDYDIWLEEIKLNTIS